MGWGVHIVTPPNSPWKKAPPPPPRKPGGLDDALPGSGTGISDEAKKQVGRSVAETAVGAFLGFDLLSKVLQAVGLGGRLLKNSRESRSVNHVTAQGAGQSPRGPGHRPPQLASRMSQASTGHRPRNARRPALLVGIASGALASALLGFAVLSSAGTASEESVTAPTSAASMPLDSQPARSSLNGNWDAISKSVVLVEAEGTDCNRFGSGTIILDGSYVLTNQHVSGDGECELEVWFTDSASDVPTRSVRAALVVSDSRLDLAVIQLLDAAGNPYIDKTRVPLKISPIVPKLGDKLFILGYPGLGGSTITLTSGDFAGVALHYEVEYFKTTASLNRGVSGGTALSADGDFLGVPTAGTGADIACEDEEPCMVVGTELGLVRPISYAQDLIARMPD